MGVHQVTDRKEVEQYVLFLERGIPSRSYGSTVSGARVNKETAMREGVVR